MTRSPKQSNDVEKFVLIDWSYADPKLIVYERRGCALTVITRRFLPIGTSSAEVQRHAVEMCFAYNCRPLMDVTGAGEAILEKILAEFE